MDLISAGQPYTDLRKIFVIFICTFDPFQDGRHFYSFENICRENTSIVLEDETAKIFLNTKGIMNVVNEDMNESLAYVENTTDVFAGKSKSELVKEIYRKVAEVKQNKEMEVAYMTLLRRDMENIELRHKKERREMAIGMLKENIDIYKIMKITGLLY